MGTLIIPVAVAWAILAVGAWLIDLAHRALDEIPRRRPAPRVGP